MYEDEERWLANGEGALLPTILRGRGDMSSINPQPLPPREGDSMLRSLQSMLPALGLRF